MDQSQDFMRFIKFCCVGAANCLVDFLVYTAAGYIMPIYLARAISWGVACLFSYAVNKSWTFRAKDRGLSPLVRFAAVNLVSLGLGILLLWCFTGLGAGRFLAYFLSLPFTTMANYLGYRFWSFREV